ncbi:MAG: nucleoside deaminase [Lachnospiraceae bacterium]|nr:nucleoside deaminase [Lachnospiraceae bacterium]
MKYSELSKIWKRIFEAEWESVCHKSKAIAAVIADENGEIISEGRNKINEVIIPNPRVNHAEVEAVRNLDIGKHPYVKSYTLYAALEPCPMCLGTLVMGGIRKVVIGARDDHGGAIELLEKSDFLASKHVEVTWMPQIYGDIQRGLQAIKELLYNEDKEKLEKMLNDFSVHNDRGVRAARKMLDDGWFEHKAPDQYAIEIIFDRLSELIESNGGGMG